MDTYIKATIDARKNLIFNHCYNSKIKKFTDFLFEKIEKMAENCKNVEKFKIKAKQVQL